MRVLKPFLFREQPTGRQERKFPSFSIALRARSFAFGAQAGAFGHANSPEGNSEKNSSNSSYSVVVELNSPPFIRLDAL
jgi:hypothetical protein